MNEKTPKIFENVDKVNCYAYLEKTSSQNWQDIFDGAFNFFKIEHSFFFQ